MHEKLTHPAKFTADYDDDAQAWAVTERDEDNMPVDQFGSYPTEKTARRAAAQKRYAAKTYRPVAYRITE